MYNLGIIFILLSGILKLTWSTDYCNPKLCTSNGVVLPHIGCKHSGQFASNCIEPAIIPVTSYLKQVILHEHNDLRNKVANGSLPGFQSAKRMTTLTWDSELEYLAELNVLQCEMEHDDCHNTIAYKYSGQNIGVQHQTDPLYPAEYESLIIFLIHEWFNEYKFADQRDTDKCLRIERENEVGHFTAMVQERTSKVGCGISRYVKFLHGENWDTILFACNYSYCNMVNLPIYIKGKMASACKTGPNPEFSGLCSLSEDVPPIPESEEVVPLHPIFTFNSHLMQPVLAEELVGAASSPRDSRSSPTKSHLQSEPSLLERLLVKRTVPSSQTGGPVPSIASLQPVPAPHGLDRVQLIDEHRTVDVSQSIPLPAVPSTDQIYAFSPAQDEQSFSFYYGISPIPLAGVVESAPPPLPIQPPPIANRPVRVVPLTRVIESVPPPLPIQPPPIANRPVRVVPPTNQEYAFIPAQNKQCLSSSNNVRPVPVAPVVEPVPTSYLDKLLQFLYNLFIF